MAKAVVVVVLVSVVVGAAAVTIITTRTNEIMIKMTRIGMSLIMTHYLCFIFSPRKLWPMNTQVSIPLFHLLILPVSPWIKQLYWLVFWNLFFVWWMIFQWIQRICMAAIHPTPMIVHIVWIIQCRISAAAQIAAFIVNMMLTTIR
ncbi:uncharacterized protein BX664DRAFT_339247 [Halteromyces radiatus]|uniref:uncharacterized protein n=1 Tax=Halteromyces radiatus TaxID=101107 RepID=UPI002220BA2F|nr:uncharacterized protein BX664DRAFT_339247 [Halteromyces radiatus]KAI8082862.1 hypothetical protein BX664DRAFT_339247 [Halteromyces radiatus]